MQRPAFLRKTKHVKSGHEDNGYSYVVIRRGPRPTLISQGNNQVLSMTVKEGNAELQLKDSSVTQAVAEPTPLKTKVVIAPPQRLSDSEEQDSAESLQLQAYQWPRLVFPPIKNSGHVILDSCTPEGEFPIVGALGMAQQF